MLVRPSAEEGSVVLPVNVAVVLILAAVPAAEVPWPAAAAAAALGRVRRRHGHGGGLGGHQRGPLKQCMYSSFYFFFIEILHIFFSSALATLP